MNSDPFAGEPVNSSDISFLDGLNRPQYQAVTATEGPVLVIAGAGSGKTRTLVHRVAYLVSNGVPPEAILLLTFTRKASQEMLWRAGRLLNDSCARVTGGTFHSIANTLLRRYGSELGFGSSFTIIDRADAEGIINLLRSSLGLGKKDRRFPSKRVIVNIISGAINKSIEIPDLIEDQYTHLLDHLDDILSLKRHYHDFKLDHGLMDYDDLLVNWQRLLLHSRSTRELVASRFTHIMVDEYQDTNLIQAEIVRLMAFDHSNVMAVGDDSQSIYSFRGADFYNIMRFPKVFDDCRIIKLEENYRSTQPILSLTNNIIENASEKYAKTLFTRIEGDERPLLYGGGGEREEAGFIADTIQSLLSLGTPPQEIAVLFRSSFHSYKLEMELTSRSLDYEKRGGLKLTESAHMKDMIAFLRVLVNPRETISWNRILLQLERVGPATAQKISGTIAASTEPFTALAAYKPGNSWKAGFALLVKLFARLLQKEKSVGELYEVVLDYYQPIFERIYSDDYPKRQKDLDQLKALMEGYQDLQTFIDDTTLDPPEESSLDRSLDRLVLSTIHSAKGLEFDAVFVLGLAEGRFPHASAVFGEQWEEERRLLYVAATRAKKHLYLTYPRQLMTPDRQFRRAGMSPFLGEIGAGLFTRAASNKGAGRGSDSIWQAKPQKSEIKKTSKRLAAADFPVGTKVSHPFFGDGVVKKAAKGRSLDIFFDRHGLKTLHLDYAKLALR